ncbi:MAG: N-acetylglucosamine-6-phosphate deacetylase, partial [Terracidiphilus sp.]
MSQAPTVLTARRLYDGSHLHEHPIVVLDGGRIASISTRATSAVPAGAPILDFPEATLAPSFFDIHIHGAAGHDAMEATPEALATIGTFLASRGTAHFLATTVTAPVNATLRAVSGLARIIAAPPTTGAVPLGIHLEGPFLSHAKRGVQPAAHLLAPDIDLFDRFYDAAEGQVRLI